MTTADILRQGAVELQRRGWTQFIRHEDLTAAAGRMCAIGAIEAGAGCPWQAEIDCPDALRALAAILPPQTSRYTTPEVITITSWNNAAEQTAENVIATLELAAICAEQAARRHPVGEPAETREAVTA